MPELPSNHAEETRAAHADPPPVSVCRSLGRRPKIIPEKSFATLRRRLAQRRWWRHTQESLPTSSLQKLLAGLEKELAVQASGRSQAGLLRIRLRQELRRLGSGAQAMTLAPEDQDTLDLVLLVFDQLWQRQPLTAPVQDALGRLQIPLVQLALMDKGFFDEPDHPAKRLFDHLVTSTFGERVDDSQARSPLSDAIERTVQSVLQAPLRDRAFYKKLDQAFLEWLAEHRQSLTRWEAQIHQEIRTQDAPLSAVDQLLQARLADCPPLPEGVALLIQTGWRQVLEAAYHAGGTAGEPWQQAVQIFDRLLWSIQPKSDEVERTALVRAIPELLRDLRQGLQTLSLENRWISARFRELQAVHLAALRIQPKFPIADTLVPGEPPPSAAVLKPMDSPCKNLGLKPGIWLDLYGQDGWQRMKFLGYGAEAERLLFADGTAQTKLAWTAGELLDHLAKARVRILGEEDSPMFDQLLENLAWTLELA